AVHVVPGLVSDVVAAHPAEAEDRVLRRLVQHLAQVNRAGRKRRPVAEVEVLSLRTRRDRLRVNLRAVPELLDLLLHLEWPVRFLRLLDHRSPAPGEFGPPRGFFIASERRSVHANSHIKKCGPTRLRSTSPPLTPVVEQSAEAVEQGAPHWVGSR